MSSPRPVIVSGISQQRESWPLHDTAATRRWEVALASSLSPHTLMQRAGLAVARLALAVAPHAHRILVFCGPGNNGGDGLLAATHLHRTGKAVDVWLMSASALPPDAASALQFARDAGVRISSDAAPPCPCHDADLVIDALFGIGLKRAPQGGARFAIDAMNAGGAPVLAIDLPSGLDADAGTPVDPQSVVRARWTLSLLTLKPGLFTAAGRDHAGEVWFDELATPGVSAPPMSAPCLLSTGSDSLWPRRRHAHHKGSFGDVWVVGGASGMRGAAWLAARAALASGAGRVMVVPVDGSSSVEFDPLHPELMLRSPDALLSPQTLLEAATVVCGCGAGDGEALRAALPTLIARAGRLLLDADAINALSADRSLAHGLAARARRGRPTVMTPHPLEAARWLGHSTAEVQADRLGSARRMSAQASATVVLKGSGSVTAALDGTLQINGSGNAALATAGTGDVLAGWIGGLWSQGLPVDRAVRLGVHSHGRAADRWAARSPNGAPLEASRLIDLLRERA